jgi:hypothetical protein
MTDGTSTAYGFPYLNRNLHGTIRCISIPSIEETKKKKKKFKSDRKLQPEKQNWKMWLWNSP